MTELVLYVCLAAEPSRCKDVRISLHNLDPRQCMMVSPGEIAKWTESHPRWFAKRWTCRPAGTVSKV